VDFTNLAVDFTNLAVDFTNLAVDRTNLAVERTNLAVERTNLAVDRTNLAVDFTNLAVDFTNLAVDRTSPPVDRKGPVFGGIGGVRWRRVGEAGDLDFLRGGVSANVGRPLSPGRRKASVNGRPSGSPALLESALRQFSLRQNELSHWL
jgi:hypothetical protein